MLSFLLALVMAIGMIPTTHVHAEEAEETAIVETTAPTETEETVAEATTVTEGTSAATEVKEESSAATEEMTEETATSKEEFIEATEKSIAFTECYQDQITYSLAHDGTTGKLVGSVSGLKSSDAESAIVTLYDAVNLYTSRVDERGNYLFEDVATGDYWLKITVEGYEIPTPSAVTIVGNEAVHTNLVVSAVTGADYFYQWKADDGYFGYEESATVPAKKTFTFLDEIIFVDDSNAAAKLERNFKIILSNEELSWNTDYATRMLELVENIFGFPNNIPSKWVLTSDEIDDDIEITYGAESAVVRLSKAVFENAIPRKAEFNGLKGTYFSNRLYHALIRYATKEGTDVYYIDRILQNDYGCSIIVEDYAALTDGITNETAAAFEMFKPEELLAILEMFAEMPQGLHRVENLEYLIRRIDGMDHPLYPDVAAVAWPTAKQGYIEFIDKAFLGNEVEDTFRLVLHEKSHFLWEHNFSQELKAKWAEIGGWYLNPNDTDGWSTSKETEFVTEYAHNINPNEDMAESIAYYILMPDRLESRSPAKYAFIRDYIMNGEIYLSQIREDLTFEVYNLYPDYKYPGRIVGVDVQVVGAPEEDKEVTVTVSLDTDNDPTMGATRGFMRISSDENTFYDLYVYPIDSSNSVLRGTLIVSKFAWSGYWYNDSITLTDTIGNQRFSGNDNFGWKLYINNPLADLEGPQYIKDSIHTEMEAGEIDGRPITYIHVKFKATDNVAVDSVYCSMANNTYNGYRLEEYGSFNNETGEGIITFIFTEYMQSGEYSVNELILRDTARNKSIYAFLSDSTGAGYPVTFNFYSENSDYEVPILDVNNITISATPTHPENPNGETVVKIEYYAKDNASGLGLVHFKLLDPMGLTHSQYHYHENFYTVFFEGDPSVWKKYDIQIILPEGSAPGIWGLLEFTLRDKAGNEEHYNFLEIVHFVIDNKEKAFELSGPDSVKVDETVSIDVVKGTQHFKWECHPGTGRALIDQAGNLTGLSAGTVTVVYYDTIDNSKFAVFEVTIKDKEHTDVNAKGHNMENYICTDCGYKAVELEITTVTLRPNCAGLYYSGTFRIDEGIQVSRMGITVSLANQKPTADNSDWTSLWTEGTTSVLISNILKANEPSNPNRATMFIYARAYVQLEDGTYIYSNVAAMNLRQVVETTDTQWDTLDDGQKSAINTMYDKFESVLKAWNLTAIGTPTSNPITDVLIISDTQTISNKTIDTDVYITSTGVATFNNVTINGNIYCYGQLVASGCTADEVYAYAYGSMMSCGAFDGVHGKVSGGINCKQMTILDNALDYAFNKWGKQ
jgi:hypothetical protein